MKTRPRSPSVLLAFSTFLHGRRCHPGRYCEAGGRRSWHLYRHFPTRDALIEGVYRNEVEKLAAASDRFTETMPQIEVLRACMLLFVDYIAAKHIFAPALNSVVGGPSRLYEGSRGLIQGVIGELVKRVKRSGDMRKDLDASDLPRALIGVSHVASARIGNKAPGGSLKSSLQAHARPEWPAFANRK